MQLVIDHVSQTFTSGGKSLPVLEDIRLTLHEEEFAALVGPSGCGKSTLLNICAGLLSPTEGAVRFTGEGLDREPRTSIVFQETGLMPWRTVYENIAFGLEAGKFLPKSEWDGRIRHYIQLVGLSGFENAYPHQLSGGMRQRAALIRTLAMEPDLLLLDEPFSALDYQTRLNVCDDIGKIIKKEGKTAILVTHDISEAISMADRVIVLAARPAYVKKKIPIRFAMEERTPMKARSAPEFKTYFNAIWKELNENA